MRWAIACIVIVGCSSSSKPAPASASGEDESIVAGPLPAGCKRMRKTSVYRCSGVPTEPNSTTTTICDDCLADTDCTDQAGGQCLQTGDQACTGPAHLVCKYPDPACGGKICPEPVIEPPP